jgi:hypothetical protein
MNIKTAKKKMNIKTAKKKMYIKTAKKKMYIKTGFNEELLPGYCTGDNL